MIARAFLGTYSTHNTHIFYRHPIYELFARLIKLKQVVELTLFKFCNSKPVFQTVFTYEIQVSQALTVWKTALCVTVGILDEGEDAHG